MDLYLWCPHLSLSLWSVEAAIGDSCYNLSCSFCFTSGPQCCQLFVSSMRSEIINVHWCIQMMIHLILTYTCISKETQSFKTYWREIPSVWTAVAAAGSIAKAWTHFEGNCNANDLSVFTQCQGRLTWAATLSLTNHVESDRESISVRVKVSEYLKKLTEN